jgi:hypothetical protein
MAYWEKKLMEMKEFKGRAERIEEKEEKWGGK